MPPEDLLLLRKSFQRLEAQGHVGVLIFYQRLVSLAPGVRLLFRGDIEGQSAKFTNMLRELLAIAEDPNRLEVVVSRLGERHAQYGTKPGHYPVVIQAFLEMLDHVLGAEATERVRSSWSGLLHRISELMQAAGAAVTEKAEAVPAHP